MIDVINLTRRNPDPAAFPINDLIKCGEENLKRDGTVVLQYGHAPGYAPLREWLTEHYSARSTNI